MLKKKKENALSIKDIPNHRIILTCHSVFSSEGPLIKREKQIKKGRINY